MSCMFLKKKMTKVLYFCSHSFVMDILFTNVFSKKMLNVQTEKISFFSSSFAHEQWWNSPVNILEKNIIMALCCSNHFSLNHQKSCYFNATWHQIYLKAYIFISLNCSNLTPRFYSLRISQYQNYSVLPHCKCPLGWEN